MNEVSWNIGSSFNSGTRKLGSGLYTANEKVKIKQYANRIVLIAIFKRATLHGTLQRGIVTYLHFRTRIQIPSHSICIVQESESE